ncbi:MAG: hypothetical protein LBM71_00835 [Elusimicrobiota bacterium]|jgi:phosphopantothenoylcysteine decarboxylase/phosphopantothenate--cysteine ligase|nr:hypothetical protein [Elusimicrobiota bacterium]
MKILITLGATTEAIDGVRFITNFSTGKTGSALADILSEKGHKVFALCGQYAKTPLKAKNTIFTDFNDLNLKLKKMLATGKFDMLINAAAISDFSLDFIEVDGKKYKPASLPKISSKSSLKLTLKNNFKIIDRVKTYASAGAASGGKKELFVVGFKLTNKASKTVAKKSAKAVLADIVVHNDLSEIQKKNRPFNIFKDGIEIAKLNGVAALANYLGNIQSTNKPLAQAQKSGQSRKS